MKKRISAAALALCLSLTGCASMLERSYTSSTSHVDRPTTAEDPSVLRVENYRELVSAVLYLVSEGAEEGVIQLHDYAGSVEEDLTAACLEVTTEDPLGAYCVDYIKHEYTRVVSYYQATLDIHYRRTQEQVRSMVRVTGTGAIRTELREALEQFAEEIVLRVSYFDQDQDSIAQLIRQTYYDTPTAALGLPETEISLYPDSGRERVVEILLTYPESGEELKRRSEETAEALMAYRFGDTNTQSMDQAGIARYVLGRMPYHVTEYATEAGGTLYDALVEERANSEGFALAYAVFCGQIDGAPACEVVEGTFQGEPWFWNSLHFSDGSIGYADPAAGDWDFHTAQELFDRGYRWPGGPEGEETSGEEILPAEEQEKEENEGESQ